MGWPLLDRWIGRLLLGRSRFPGVITAQALVRPRQRLLVTVLGVAAFQGLQRVPGVDVPEEQVQAALAANPLLSVIDLFTGGDLLRDFSLAATGVFPYLLALALVNLALGLWPRLRQTLVDRGGEAARERLELLLTVVLAFLFAYGLALLLSRPVGLVPAGLSWFTAATFLPGLRLVALLTLGGVLSGVIASLITTWGLVRGEGVILLVGAAGRLLGQAIEAVRAPAAVFPRPAAAAVVLAGGLAASALSWVLATGRIRIPVVVPTRSAVRTPAWRGRSMEPVLPLPLNAGGIQPLAGAIGIQTLLAAFGGVMPFLPGLAGVLLGLRPPLGGYWLSLALLLALFTWACNASLLWQPGPGQLPVWEQLKRQGLFIPGVRPGEKTRLYLEGRMRRNTLWAAAGMVLLGAVLPWLVGTLTAVNLHAFVLEIYVVVQTLEGAIASVKAHVLSHSDDSLLR